ncbi:MAG: ribosome-associated translation inhibitor RaiA [Alphaproteobacteria bacterium]|nr:ribosome-associated translation inhibitor RaiA [Alphaproteobacteria bacterium]NDC56350.1 ribosome-associated translation inhibitor RaiA [Alphaproteobacteria bacterium]NDG04689.1 ribosome-associated translation inhibitor RaiA [Alphaproteobacteria bacterium]
MQLTVKGKQIDVGEALRGYIEKNLHTVVSKYFDHPLDAVVTVSKEAHLFVVDAQVHASAGIHMQSDASASEPYPAVDEALARLDGRLRRYKKKLRDHHEKKRHHEEQQAKAYVINPHEADEEGHAHENPVVVAEMTTPVLTMSVSEAVMCLDLSRLPAMLFRNPSNGGLNMVYRRADGHIGWVDPAQNVAVNQKTAKSA